jgi:hypothetical protein
MLYLLFHPGTDHEERIPFSVSEASIDDALDYGRAETPTAWFAFNRATRKSVRFDSFEEAAAFCFHPENRR